MTALPEEVRALATDADHQLAAPDPYLPDLLIAQPDWARSALDAVRLPPC